MFAADVDGDGDIDVVSGSLADDKIAWYENDGSSQNFTTHTISTSADGAHSVFVADIDNDGDLDVLSASQKDNKIAWYENSDPRVVDRHVFYNDSAFDNPISGLDDEDAIASDKTALLPGQAATFANYTSYAEGLNGIMVDVAELANPNAISATDFEFQVGDDNDVSQWNAAPAPTSVNVVQLPGTNVHRVTIIWSQTDAVKNQWLQIKMLANSNTGLASPDVFYFGNLIGDVGNMPTAANTDFADIHLAMSHLFANATLDSAYDIDRDGVVNFIDLQLMFTNVFQGIHLIMPTSNANASFDIRAVDDVMIEDDKEAFAVDGLLDDSHERLVDAILPDVLRSRSRRVFVA